MINWRLLAFLIGAVLLIFGGVYKFAPQAFVLSSCAFLAGILATVLYQKGK